MQSFKAGQQSWEIRLTLYLVTVIKKRTGVDVHALFMESEFIKMTDVAIVADIIWACCERQATERRIDYETFLTEVMDAASFEKATDAFLDSIVDYLPKKKAKKAKRFLASLREIDGFAKQESETALSNLETKVANHRQTLTK